MEVSRVQVWVFSMELINLVAMVRRRKWLFVQSVVFFVFVAALLAMVLPKNYEATARVLVSSSDSSLSILGDLGLSEIAAGLSGGEDDIITTIALTTSRPQIESLIWQLQLRDDDGDLYLAEEVLVAGLAGHITGRPNLIVTQQQGTTILDFTASSTDPQLSQIMADTAVLLSVQTAQERSREDTRAARLFVEQQLRVVEEEFDSAMREMAEAQANEDVLDLEAEMKAGIERVSELMLSYEDNAANIQEVRAKISEQIAYQGREHIGSVSPRTSQLNLKVQALQAQLLALSEQRAEALTVKTSKHPDVIDIDALIVQSETALQEALSEQHQMDPLLQDLESSLAGFIEKGAQIQASIDSETETFGQYPDKMRRISRLELAANAAESVYTALQEQSYQIGVAEAMRVSDLQPIEVAALPSRHSSPKLLINLMLGLVLGTGFGLVLVLLVETFDDSIKELDDLSETWGITRLGMIPWFSVPRDRPHLIATLEPTHPISEAYRTVRNGLLFASVDSQLRTLGVTSGMPQEGKSTFSANIAVSLARDGQRVLIVDCDLRRNCQHRFFAATSNQHGLTDVLTGEMRSAEAIQPTGVANLWLLASGPVPTDPAKLVESERLKNVFEELKKNYDMIVVDTPPALVVNDSIVISRILDGVVVVVEANKTTHKMWSDLSDRFSSSDRQPTGVVLNKVSTENSRYSRYYASYTGSTSGVGGVLSGDSKNKREGGKS